MTGHECVDQLALLLQPGLYARIAAFFQFQGLHQILQSSCALQTSVGDTSRSSLLLLAFCCS